MKSNSSGILGSPNSLVQADPANAQIISGPKITMGLTSCELAELTVVIRTKRQDQPLKYLEKI
jgi:hypothetical protein